MRWHTWHDPAAFLTSAGEHLRVEPLWNQFLLGIPATLVQDPSRYPNGGRLCSVHDASGGCVGAVVQTPHWPVHLSRMPLAVAAFAGARFAEAYPDLAVAFGAEPEVTAFMAAASVRREPPPVSIAPEQANGLFEIVEVVDLPRAEGAARLATEGDAPLLQTWIEAFRDEATPGDPFPAPEAGARAVARGRTWLWVDAEGVPVTFANYGRDFERWVSIGPVYTPPERRGHGYATSLVAEMSARIVADGRRCTLFTDLENPTSNRIYERIGYRRLGDMVRLRFEEK